MKKKEMTMRYQWLIYFMIVSSSMVVLQISRRTVFLILQILFCGLIAFQEKKIVFIKHKAINCMFLGIFLSAVSACISDIPYSYKKAAVAMTIFLIPLYLTVSYICSLLRENKKLINIIRQAIKVMCIIQLAWIPLQYITYNFLNVDINQKIFVEILECVENATFIRDWKWHPSGLSWHSAILAPMFVIAFVLFENIYMRTLIIFDAIICGNSTAVIGVGICAVLLLYFYLNKTKARIRIKKELLFIFGIFGIIVVCVVYKMGIWEVLVERLVHLFIRLFSEQKDASTAAHFAYFTDYGIVFKNSSLLQILFGYGYGCSGFPYSMMYDRYTELANWAVECDVMDILVSRGIFGFIAHYYMLFFICYKGYKINYRYMAMIIPIIIQGIGYNVQWDYVLFIELILFLTIILKINFFCTEKGIKN